MTHPSAVDVLTARVDRLERTARRWRRAAIGFAMVALLAAGPATKPAADEVRTHRLVLLDEHDRPAAVLQHTDGTGSGLVFVDPAHPTQIVSAFGWAADGSGLEQVDTRDGRVVVAHTGAVTDKGVPVEQVKEALEAVRKASAR